MMIQTKDLILVTLITLLFAPTAVYTQDVSAGLASSQRLPAASAEEIHPLLIGMKIPGVTLNEADGSPFPLLEAVGKKPTILIFYRGGWCPYCTAQMGKLQTVEPELLKLGYQMFAISADRPSKLRESIGEKDLNYTLLSDSGMSCSRAFGLAYKVDEMTVERYKQHDIDLEESSGLKHHLLPVPAVFIVGTDGVIKFDYINPNYKVRIDPDLLLAAARAALK